MDRRRLLVALGVMAAGSRPGRAGAGPSPAISELEERVLEVQGEKLARKCLLLVPRERSAARRLLVLFHGLGETSSEAIGIRAWADRYGLLAAARRLREPPVARTLKDVVLLTDSRLAELNAQLAREPFRGLAVACPFTPNVFKQPSTAQALDRYASWVTEALLPELRRELGLASGAGAVGIDGVSLGGYVSLEVFLRRPEAFAAAGATQGAFGENLADAYAARFEQALARVGSRPLRIATSEWDSKRSASERLVAKLAARGVRAELALSPGGHDQRYLREVGSLELLHHYDRTLGSAPSEAK
jgi:predicted esterase